VRRPADALPLLVAGALLAGCASTSKRAAPEPPTLKSLAGRTLEV